VATVRLGDSPDERQAQAERECLIRVVASATSFGMWRTRRIESEIIIDAPPERVWQVIADLDRYPQWNRFTPRLSLASRDLVVGAEFDLDCRMTERQLLENEHEVILAVEHDPLEPRYALCMGTSRTRGRPGIRSERWQICRPLGARTLFSNHEAFSGPLAPLVYALYARKLRRAFRLYCLDLQARVEGLSGLSVQYVRVGTAPGSA
jgi:hypothetical protein